LCTAMLFSPEGVEGLDKADGAGERSGKARKPRAVMA